MTDTPTSLKPSAPRLISALIEALLLISILGGAAYFRLSGLYWGDYQFLHPDERFLIWVGTDISPVENLSQYFDTVTSSLNPHNRGHGFYVYGTFPMFLARYLVQWQYGGSGWVEMTKTGRLLSTGADLLTVLLVYLIARRLFGRWVGLLGMAFSAAVVLQIQQAHFFTMDTFTTAFSTLALYFAVLIATSRPQASIGWPSVLFGIALGMAVSSKINTAPVAVMLPVAMVLFYFRLSPVERDYNFNRLLLWLGVAALVSVVVFRCLQPYAFSGPGFFGLKPNPLWVDNIRTQRAQAGPDVDFPPAMQWARRPASFSFQNLVVWGLGLPLGILAWAGFLWAGWRIFAGWRTNRTEALTHLLPWSWTAAYFAWQSLQLNPTMRYQLPIYPTLVIFAAWGVSTLFTAGGGRLRRRFTGAAIFPGSDREWRQRQANGPTVFPNDDFQPRKARRPLQVAAVLITAIVLAATYGYAYAFSQIYTRPITRVAATQWIYANIPGPINLAIDTGEGMVHQMLPFPYATRITAERPYIVNFTPRTAGSLRELYLPGVLDTAQNPVEVTLRLLVFSSDSAQEPLATADLKQNFGSPAGQIAVSAAPAAGPPSIVGRGRPYTLVLNQPVRLEPNKSYALAFEVQGAQASAFQGEAAVTIFPSEDSSAAAADQVLSSAIDPALQSLSHLRFELTPQNTGWLSLLRLRGAPDTALIQRPQALSLAVESSLANAEVSLSELTFQETNTDGEVIFALNTPPLLNRDETYFITIEMQPQGSALALSAPGIANEGEWDDALPLRMDGYDGFGGFYPLDLNFNMYWDDTLEKLERFVRILDQSEYIVISSNRQWGSLPRLPERFPLTTLYYRELLGCPEGFSIEACYRVAEPGTFQSRLGFQLIKTFTSEPTLGPLRLNDQFAEEAFTVYDHPKVFIFKKDSSYDARRVRATLETVDFSKVIRVAPLRAGAAPRTLLLPEERWREQQAAGTWSELFDTEALHNRYPLLAVIVWYLTITLLGWIVYPLLRLALPGVHDRGYPLARIAGMLLLAYFVWLLGSARLPVTRGLIALVALALGGIGTAAAWRDRRALLAELRSRRGYYVIVEGLFLAFFVAFLLVRIANPDLWHPWKGGEKPMDFSYFNAVLKSITFPPYDPWYAGGYLNYYYYGFVLVGMPVKLLGITPAVAYNLILPTLFSLIAMGAFSAAWNLVQFRPSPAASEVVSLNEDRQPDHGAPAAAYRRWSNFLFPYFPALAAALGTAVLGNLGTVRMIYQGFQRLAAPNGDIQNAGLLQLWVWGIRGLAKSLTGANLPYNAGDWYWLPSRAIPAPMEVEPITEFPYFSVLYADLHAHLIALPLTLLALGLVIGLVLGRGRWRSLGEAATWFTLTGLTIGALRPTNTWDMPTYLALAVVAILYTALRHFQLPQNWVDRLPILSRQPVAILRLAAAAFGAAALGLMAFFFYQPYAHWYALGYTKLAEWQGATTPVYSYLIHWGLFIFVLVSWMVWETYDWMASTPASALRKLAPYRFLLQALVVTLLCVIFALLVFFEVHIAWLALTLGAWALILLLRPGLSDAKRLVLFLFGTGLVLTLMVEMIVLVGDVGRMNTVFKFYLQVWVLFAVGAAAALGWALPHLRYWHPSWRAAWQAVLTALVFSAFLYTFMATLAKIEDRMAPSAPATLDGMAYMPYAAYVDEWGSMDLDQDYRAIRWLQENVSGSPVIVEANLRNLYRWGSRFTIYTGLPGVVGWEWHQQQQRAVASGLWVTERILEIDNFYTGLDLGEARDFLQKYNVRYIIVGLQERGHYPGAGLQKFEAADGALWNEVYRDRETVIYEVITSGP